MAESYRVLAQVKPTAATLTAAYTVPDGKCAIISTVGVCNQSATLDTFRISIGVDGEADASKQYLKYDEDVDSSFPITEGWTLGDGDVLRVYSTNGTSSFTIFGLERSE